jgi:hypothetical protein
VILVELEQIVDTKRPVHPAPPAGDGGQDLLLADRMAVVEVENVHGSVP